jgi:hypothetical protein
VNYDTTKNPATEPEDYYLGIWVSDSDSHKNLADPDDYLRYYEVEWDDTNEYWYMPNYGSGWKISAVTYLKAFPGEDRPVADAGGPYVSNEGTSVTFNGGSSTDPGSDPLKYRWDFDGDGDWDTNWASSATVSRTWSDDYTGDVYLEVFDGRLRDVDITTVTVNNVAPTISAGDDTISENGVATISGTITDPGSQDTFSVQIDWKDGNVIDYNYGAGTTSFSETHQYLDDDPTGTHSDDYTISLTITDDDGDSGSDQSTVTVNNVPPALTLTGDVVFENDYATLSGTITDVGTQDTFRLDVNWGEGAPETFYYPAGTTIFAETHQYLDDNPTATTSDIYTISAILRDDDTCTDHETTSITVNNVAPVTTIDNMDQPNPMFILPLVHTLDFTGSFTDVGTQDTHSATWDWGDTSSEAGLVTEADGLGAVTGSHVYSEPGTYTVTLTVTDDDGNIDSDTFIVEVVDASEALNILIDYLEALPDEAYKNNADQRINALTNMVTAIQEMIDDEEYNGAIQDLLNNIREKADGTVDGKENNDWITDGTAQNDICLSIDDITDYLATFL